MSVDQNNEETRLIYWLKKCCMNKAQPGVEAWDMRNDEINKG